jgi:hypothetical protein
VSGWIGRLYASHWRTFDPGHGARDLARSSLVIEGSGQGLGPGAPVIEGCSEPLGGVLELGLSVFASTDLGGGSGQFCFQLTSALAQLGVGPEGGAKLPAEAVRLGDVDGQVFTVGAFAFGFGGPSSGSTTPIPGLLRGVVARLRWLRGCR